MQPVLLLGFQHISTDILISVICFKIRSNLKVGRSTRMHCITKTSAGLLVFKFWKYFVP